MRYYKTGIRTALRAMGANRLRTALTLLGFVIGVAAVVAMVAIGQGTRAEMLAKIESLGSNLLIIQAGQAERVPGRGGQVGAEVTTLRDQDANALAEEIPLVRSVAPAQSRRMQLTYGDLVTATTVVGTSPEFQDVRTFYPEIGEFFDEEHMRTAARVVVLGRSVADRLFGDADPIGETIRLERVPFTVLGVMERKGLDIVGQDQDDQVFVPLSSALRRLFNLDHISTIYVSVRHSDGMGRAIGDIRDVLRDRHRLRPDTDDDFTIQNQTAMMETQEVVSGTFTLLLGSIGAISLLVGGIGVLAMMLISVRERTREIGIRRAVGARRKDIMSQFLVETMVLSVCGGIGGITLGIAGAWIASLLTDWPMLIPWGIAVLAVAFSTMMGIVFGVYPALRAASVDPINALRSE